MSAPIVLVAFASQAGSTASIAEVIATELRAAGLRADCRPASEVDDVTPYGAIVLGSGVFVRGRQSDGGGFLVRHALEVAARPTWLFCVGPIGRGGGTELEPASDGPVVVVARAIGARGAAAFGTGPGHEADADDIGRPVDLTRVRTWARGIAAELAPPAQAPAAEPGRPRTVPGTHEVVTA
jgi:menaquinone-dependent protoporphyrinogen oxidase